MVVKAAPAASDDRGQHQHEHPVDRNVESGNRRPGTEQPLGQHRAHFLGADEGTKALLHREADAPGGEQRVERPLVQVADECPLDQPAGDERKKERQQHGERKVVRQQRRCMLFDERRAEIDGVGADGHELAMRHVDDAHLAEDDRETETHQQQHREQAQPREALHQANVQQL